jgi:hypothetical protein
LTIDPVRFGKKENFCSLSPPPFSDRFAVFDRLAAPHGETNIVGAQGLGEGRRLGAAGTV